MTPSALHRVGSELEVGPSQDLDSKTSYSKRQQASHAHASSQTAAPPVLHSQPATCSGQGEEGSGGTGLDRGFQMPKTIPRFCLTLEELPEALGKPSGEQDSASLRGTATRSITCIPLNPTLYTNRVM